MNRRAFVASLPADPPRCDRCGKIAGDFKGYLGAECQCDREAANPALTHSISTGTRR